MTTAAVASLGRRASALLGLTPMAITPTGSDKLRAPNRRTGFESTRHAQSTWTRSSAAATSSRKWRRTESACFTVNQHRHGYADTIPNDGCNRSTRARQDAHGGLMPAMGYTGNS